MSEEREDRLTYHTKEVIRPAHEITKACKNNDALAEYLLKQLKAHHKNILKLTRSQVNEHEKTD